MNEIHTNHFTKRRFVKIKIQALKLAGFKLFLSVLLSITSIQLMAQNVDCGTATTICDDPTPTGNPSGNGLDDYADPDNDPGCLQNESANSSWYYFELDNSTPPNSILGFIITPSGGAGEDYDWALFGPGVGCGNLGSPIRCSSSSEFCAFCPQTGMGMGATDFSEGPGTGDGFVSTITVNAGDGFFLNINNWKGTGNGFSLDFTGSAAEFLDCGAEPPCSVIASAGNNIVKCQGDPDFNLDVNASGGKPPYTYTWVGTGNGTNYLDNPDVKSPKITLPPDFSGTITYTVTVTDGFCSATDDVVVTVNPKPVVTINQPPKLCSNGSPITLTGTPPNSIWGGIASSNGTVNPSQLPAGIYQATLSATNSFGCKNTATVDIEIVDPVDVVVEQIDPQCLDDVPFQIIPIPQGGKWSGNIDPDGTFDPGKYGVGSHTAIYSITSAEGCKSEEVIVIDVLPLPDIQIKDPGQLCSDELAVQIDYSPLGGTWTGPIDQLGNIYPNQIGAGTFKIKYSVTSPEGCFNSDSLSITINNPPKAVLSQPITICNSTLSGQSTLVDFDQLIISGDDSGYWTDKNNSGATGNFPVLNFNGTKAGSYIFTYTTQSAQGNCKEYSGDVEIIVIDCNCPSTAIKSPGTYCTENADFDLNQFKLTNESGTWKITNFPPGTNPATISVSSFSGTGKDAGTYTLQFTLNNFPGANCPDNSTTQVTLVDPPSATISSLINVCNQMGSGAYPFVINLYDFILSGDKSGFWTDKDNSGATGTFLNLDFSGVAPGQYTFQYNTNSATAPCTEKNYSLIVNVSDCNCPVINLLPAAKLCADNGLLNLSDLQSNSDPGLWSIKSTPSGNKPAILSNNTLISSNSDPGLYTLTYTLTNPVNGCPDNKDLQIELISPPSATVTGIAQVCNSTGTGGFITTIDFSLLVTSGDLNGTWVDSDNSGATGSFPVLDFTNVPTGNYNFVYTTSSATAPCSNLSYPVTIIVKNCDCPDISLLPTTEVCSDQVSFDLKSILLTTEPGIWTVSNSPSGSNPLVINANILSLNNVNPGQYTLKYSLTVPPPNGCPTSSETIITIIKAANSGISTPELNLCYNSKELISLDVLLNGEDAGGIWTVANNSALPGSNFDSNNATLTNIGLQPGKYLFDYTVPGIAPCFDKTTQVTIMINDLPSINAGVDQEINCTNTTVKISPILSPATNMTIFWSGPGIQDPTTLVQNIKKEGEYIIQATNNLTNCSSYDTIQVTSKGNPITNVEYSVKNTSCKSVENGKLTITTIEGGTPDYTLTLNGVEIANTGKLENLKSGTYELLIKDANDCSYTFGFNIEEGEDISVNLGPDLYVLAGDTYDISLIASIPDNQIKSIVWTPNVCGSCLTFSEIAEGNISYDVLLEDQNGCKASDKINVFVKPVRRVFIPNVFSPDGNGINDNFFIFSDGGVEKIKNLRIYDRWGELLFENSNIQPNDPKVGWNGKFKGQKLDNGVYVFVAEIVFTDGETEIYKGDITISR